MSNLRLNILRFCPISKWEADVEGPQWVITENEKKTYEEPMYVKDVWTGDKYLNDEKWLIRSMCGLAALGTPFAHPVTVLVNLAWRIAKIISCYELWREPEEDVNPNFDYDVENSLKYRSCQYGKDILRIFASPLVVPMLEISAIYGIIMPYDGRKLYAQTELAFYGKPFLGQCFAPKPTRHLFGGNIKEKGKI